MTRWQASLGPKYARNEENGVVCAGGGLCFWGNSGREGLPSLWEKSTHGLGVAFVTKKAKVNKHGDNRKLMGISGRSGAAGAI